MKKLLILPVVLLLVGCAAKNAHVASRSVKYVATLSPAKAVKDSAKASKFAVKESAKQGTFPVRHPKKSAHAVVKAGKQVF